MVNNKKKEQSLSASFSELEAIAEEFEQGEVDLEKGIPKFKRGLVLARRLKKRLGEIDRICLDASKAKKLLGWEPKTSFNEGLKKTIEWQKENK